MLKRPQPRVAVLLRAFKIDDKLLDLYTAVAGAGAAYDVFLLVDETNGGPVTPRNDVIRHSLASCASIGLSYTRPDLFWLCSDIPMFFVMAALPDYTHFIQLDYDVHFVRSGVRFLNRVVDAIGRERQGPPDAIGLQHTVLEAPCDWPYYARAAEVFETVRFFYGPFSCLSRRALTYLLGERQREHAQLAGSQDLLIAEAFIPSHLMAAGFHCVDLADVAPGSYEAHAHATSMRLGPVGLPLGGRINVRPSIEMVHPVYSVEDHLTKAVRHADGPDGLSRLRGRLLGDDYAFVVPEVRSRYIAMIERDAAAKGEELAAAA